MASVIVSMRIMPDSPEADLVRIEKECVEAIKSFGAMSTKVDIQPFAFGLKSLNVLFVQDEAKGGTEELEKQLTGIEGVQSAEVTDVRRTLG